MAQGKHTKSSRRKDNDNVKRDLKYPKRSIALKRYWRKYKKKHGKRPTYKRTKKHREKMSKIKTGTKHSIKSRKKISKNHANFKGTKNPNWQGGIRTLSDGRVELYRPKHPKCTSLGYVKRYRLVMEKHIGRHLKKVEVVHHIDGDVTNDSLDNLLLFPNNSAHRKYHAKKS